MQGFFFYSENYKRGTELHYCQNIVNGLEILMSQQLTWNIIFLEQHDTFMVPQDVLDNNDRIPKNY